MPIRIVTARRLVGLETELDQVRERLAGAQADAARGREEHQVREKELRWEADQARAALEAVVVERDVARGRVESLRAEVGELVEEIQRREKAAAESRWVYVLTRLGELHSVHGSSEGAKAEAERHGAGSGCWGPVPEGRPLLASGWRVSALLLPGVEAAR